MEHLSSIHDIERLIENGPWMMATLRMVASLHLPDWYIGAGFVRNAVWDHLHGFEERTPLNDIDVIYFNRQDPREQAEVQIEHRLTAMDANRPWSVKNQARMHVQNNDAPYTSSLDALSRWPETVTCIGARIDTDDCVRVVAPHGVDDLLALRVRPSPHAASRIHVYRARMAKKRWRDTWPKLDIADA